MKSMRIIAMALIVTSGAALSMAQEVQDSVDIRPKSPFTAASFSLFGTLMPVTAGAILSENEDTRGIGLVLVGAGVVVGPGLGHAYAHNNTQLVAGAVIRLVSARVAIAAIDKVEIFSDEDNSLPMLLFLVGGTICVASAAHDIVFARRSAENYNRSVARAGLSVRPTYFARQEALGFSVSLRL
jgi:hypothetical protein